MELESEKEINHIECVKKIYLALKKFKLCNQ